MSLRTNLVLAAVLVGMSSFAYWYEFKKKGEIERAKEAETRLIPLATDLEAESVKIVLKDKGIDLEMDCREHCKLSDPSGKWEIVKPGTYVADEANVGTFITTITASNIQDSLPIEGDLEAGLEKFGLGKAKRENSRIELKFKKDAEPYTVFVGDSSAVGENMYVYVTGPGQKKDVIRIVPGHLRVNMERKVSYWRAKKLFNLAASEIDSFKLVNADGTVEITRDGYNWLLPGKRLADTEAVETFLTGLVFMTAQDFVDNAKLPPKPKYSVTLKPLKKDPVTLEIFDVLVDKKTPKIYARMSGKNSIFELDRASTEKFGKKAESFRFRNLITAAEKEEIEKVSVTFGGSKEKLVFEKGAASWTPNVDQALIKIGAARIADFTGKKGAPSGAQMLSNWELMKKDGKLIRGLTVYGTVDKSKYYAKLQNDEQVILERGSGSTIPSSAADFQKVAQPEKK